MAAKDHLSPYQFKYTDAGSEHMIEAYHPSFGGGTVPVGNLRWQKEREETPHRTFHRGEVLSVDVMPGHRRKGVARTMYGMAQEYDPKPARSPHETKLGTKFFTAVGG